MWPWPGRSLESTVIINPGCPGCELPSEPLVNVNMPIYNHHVEWENSLFLWPFSIASLTQPGGMHLGRIKATSRIHAAQQERLPKTERKETLASQFLKVVATQLSLSTYSYQRTAVVRYVFPKKASKKHRSWPSDVWELPSTLGRNPDSRLNHLG